MLKKRMIRSALSTVICSILYAAHAVADEPKRIDIPAGELAVALETLSRQAAIDLVFQPDQLKSFRTEGVSGAYSPQDAIRILLRGTPFQLRIDASSGAMLIAAPTPAKTSSISVVPPPPDDERSRYPWSHLAQSDSPSSSHGERRDEGAASGSEQSRPQNADERRSSLRRSELEEILITGSRIRGEAPVGSSLTVLSREDILETGFASLQDVLKDVPQNFGAGLSEISGGVGNFTRGTGFNLRGFGTGATLTLINGRRPSPSGDVGDYFDIDSVPLAAIERIEILSDGASAIYGSDAIAGVINIILRRNYDGAETQARHANASGYEETSASQIVGTHWQSGGVMAGYQYYRRGTLKFGDRDYAAADKRPFGGRDFRNTFSNPGNIRIGALSYAIPHGQDGTALTPASFIAGTTNLQDRDPRADLLPGNELHSAFFDIRQQATPALELALEGRVSKRESHYTMDGDIAVLSVPNTNAFYVNPTGGTGPLTVFYNMADDMGPRIADANTDTFMATLGATYSFANSWRAVISNSYGREEYESTIHNGYDIVRLNEALADSNAATAFNAFADGSNTNPRTLAAIRTDRLNEGATDIFDTSVVLDGSVVELPGGEVRVAFGGSYRDEGLTSALGRSTYGRSVAAAYGELTVPIVGTNNTRAGLHALELSIAGRYDRYNDVGDTTNPRIGLRYAPVRSLTLRSSWGTSFKAPRLYDLDDVIANPASASFLTVFDPLSTTPTQQSVILVINGNNRNLKPEKASSWSMGFDFTPGNVPGLSFSATYYDMDYQDRIVQPGPASITAILAQESTWSEIITRTPTADQLASACIFVRVGSCAATPPVAIVDQRQRNIARLHQRGVDVDARLALQGRLGQLSLGLHGTYVLSNEQQVSAASEPVDMVATPFNPTDLRLRGTAAWSRGGWGANLAVNYTDEIDNTLSVPPTTIGAWTTIDAGLSYRLAGGSAWYSDTTLAVRAVNVLDEDPPFANFFVGFDQSNANPLGRLISLHVTKEW